MHITQYVRKNRTRKLELGVGFKSGEREDYVIGIAELEEQVSANRSTTRCGDDRSLLREKIEKIERRCQ